MRVFRIPLVFLLAVGCSSAGAPEQPSDSPGWDGNVQQWGTLRDVMHGKVMDGQVRLSDATDKPHTFGIGAPDKLQGEILIADSVAWLAKIKDDNQIVTQRSSPEDSAVLLAVAQVPLWSDVAVDQDVSADDFDDFIKSTMLQAGLDKLETVPFMIEGQFSSLNLHVLNGQCPFAVVKVDVGGAGPPHRTTLNDVEGLLVGFYAENGAGRITHHSTSTHVHALVENGDDQASGHVDAVALKAGSVIRVPVLSSGRMDAVNHEM
jgi:alpha-acetolactate decarboxylase